MQIRDVIFREKSQFITISMTRPQMIMSFGRTYLKLSNVSLFLFSKKNVRDYLKTIFKKLSTPEQAITMIFLKYKWRCKHLHGEIIFPRNGHLPDFRFSVEGKFPLGFSPGTIPLANWRCQKLVVLKFKNKSGLTDINNNELEKRLRFKVRKPRIPSWVLE